MTCRAEVQHDVSRPYLIRVIRQRRYTVGRRGLLRRGAGNQGLSLAHFSAQFEPFLTQTTPHTTPHAPQHPLKTPQTTPKCTPYLTESA